MEYTEYMKYKNILWIDDIDDSDSDFNDDFLSGKKSGGEPPVDHTLIKDYFGTHWQNVKLERNFFKALKELENENTKYDLIVFDINLDKGIDRDKFPEIQEKLRKKRVEISEKIDEVDEYIKRNKIAKQFAEKAGMYLYLFLLNCGYPNNRMVILTGNGTTTNKDFLKAAHIFVDCPDSDTFIFEKTTDEKISSKWVDRYYREDYYQVRRLVYKACEYWKETLDRQECEIAFNTIYYTGNKKDQKQDKGLFINMLERIELLFPTALPKPDVRQKIYYHALQIATMFHETSAKIETLDEKYPKLKCYHQAVRNFRNWSAHNKFGGNGIDASFFAYMFCIALRSYFQPSDNQFVTDDAECYKAYEKECNQLHESTSIDKDCFRQKYSDAFKRHFFRASKVPCTKECQGCQNCQTIDGILLYSGKNKSSDSEHKMHYSDVLLNILDKWKTVQINNMPEWKNARIKDPFKCVTEYDWNDECTLPKPGADIFKNKAYELFCSLNPDASDKD